MKKCLMTAALCAVTLTLVACMGNETPTMDMASAKSALITPLTSCTTDLECWVLPNAHWDDCKTPSCVIVDNKKVCGYVANISSYDCTVSKIDYSFIPGGEPCGNDEDAVCNDQDACTTDLCVPAILPASSSYGICFNEKPKYYRDADGDGYGDPDVSKMTMACESVAGYTEDNTDCDDTDDSIHPQATELCNEIDDNCADGIDETFTTKGQTCTIGVGTCLRAGVYVCSENGVGVVCDAVPGTPTDEVCDGLDNDCDNATDEDLGSTSCGVGLCKRTVQNCKDGVVQICVPGTPTDEVCDGLDQDCDGVADNDLPEWKCGVGECERIIPSCFEGEPTTCVPGEPEDEVCDLKDNDCDNATDEDLGSTTCGVGECKRTVANCVEGVVQICVPGTSVTEVCDLKDNDCDGQIDENLGTSHCGVGACKRDTDNCVLGVPQTCVPGTPGVEICDGWDNDCDGLIDEGFGEITCGVGECARTVPYCFLGQIQTCTAGQPTTEVCDGMDNDCDNATDEDLPLHTYYEDLDKDGYGDLESPVVTCALTPPEGSVANHDDCDDTDATFHPGATEICDGLDNDCDGQTDEGGICNPSCANATDMSTGSSFSFTIAAGQTSYLDGYTGTCVRTGVTNGNGEKVFKYVVSATGKVTFTATSGKKLRLYRLDDVCQATACQMMGFGSVYESVTYMTEPGEVIYVSVENTDALAASGTMTVVFTAPL